MSRAWRWAWPAIRIECSRVPSCRREAARRSTRSSSGCNRCPTLRSRRFSRPCSRTTGERHKDIRGVFRRNYATAIALDDAPLDAERASAASSLGPTSRASTRWRRRRSSTRRWCLTSTRTACRRARPLHHEPPGVRRGAPLVDRVSHRHRRRRARGVVRRSHPLRPDRANDGRRALRQELLCRRSSTEMATQNRWADSVLERLDAEFTMRDLKDAIEACRPREHDVTLFDDTTAHMLWLAHSNYELDFASDSELSERVIFPVTENESRGIEDARFVRFTYPDGRVEYYATYTAYNGFRVLPQLIVDDRFPAFQGEHAERSLRPEQGDGALPAQDRRPLRDGVAARRREHLPSAVRQHPLLERIDVRARTEVPVGVRSDWKLRLSHRDGERAGSS